MRFFCHCVVFFFTFNVHVKVNAQDYVQLLPDNKVIEEPEDCILKSSVCAIKTHWNRKFELQVGSSLVIIDGRSIVLRTGSDSIRLVRGGVWVRAIGKFRIVTEYGIIKGQDGEMWVRRKNNKVYAKATFHDLQMKPKGGHNILDLPTGFQNWLGPVDQRGAATTGMPSPIDFEDHIIRWARLFPGTAKEFTRKVRQLQKVWSDAVYSAGPFHADFVNRQLATAAEQERIEAERLRRIQEENRRLRQRFRRRNYYHLVQ